MNLTNELEKINFKTFQICNLIDVLDDRMYEKSTLEEQDRWHTLMEVIKKELKELTNLQYKTTDMTMNLENGETYEKNS